MSRRDANDRDETAVRRRNGRFVAGLFTVPEGDIGRDWMGSRG